MIEHKNDHSWVTQTEDLQWNVGNHTPRNSNIVCLQKFDEYNNKFGKGWSPGSKLMLAINTSTLTTLKMYFSDHPFIKHDIFEVNVNSPRRGPPIGIVTQYCEHHNMSYIYQ